MNIVQMSLHATAARFPLHRRKQESTGSTQATTEKHRIRSKI